MSWSWFRLKQNYWSAAPLPRAPKVEYSRTRTTSRVWVEAEFLSKDPRSMPGAGYAVYRLQIQTTDGESLSKSSVFVAVTTVAYRGYLLATTAWNPPPVSVIHMNGVQSYYGSSMRAKSWLNTGGADENTRIVYTNSFVPYANVRSPAISCSK